MEQEKDITMQEKDVANESEHRSSSEHRRHSHHHHHHSHHSHHHHHHRHRKHKKSSKNSRNKQAFKQFLRNNRKKLIVFCAALFFCFCSVLAGTFMDNMMHRGEDHSGSNGTAAGSTEVVTEGMVSIGVSVFDQPVSLINSAVQAHLEASAEADPHEIYTQYNGDNVRLDIGAPLKLSYKISAAPSNYVVSSAVFTLSENADLSNPVRQTVPAGKDAVEFTNLKTGTAYYYRLDVTFTNGVESAVLGDLTTAYGPRMMTVDGGYNLRDVGGWLVSGGKRIKQGLLYRGCEIDGAVEPQYCLTEAGKSYMLTQMNIKTDMDLRNKADTPNGADVLGANVKHTYYGSSSYTSALSAENADTMRRIFADLADPAQYPAYLHCTYGLDRTGTVCYLLGALLGMDEDNLLKEYQLSAMSQGYVATDGMTNFVQYVHALPGFTLSEKVETYLLGVGVTPAQIQSIRDIFLEDIQ